MFVLTGWQAFVCARVPQKLQYIFYSHADFAQSNHMHDDSSIFLRCKWARMLCIQTFVCFGVAFECHFGVILYKQLFG